MLNNPIIRRELLGLLRTRRALALQVGMVAALAVLVLVRWPTEGMVDLSGQQAQQVMRVFGYGLMTVLILLAPVFPATTIVREKQQGTLTLLLNSPMTRWQILFGKYVGVAGFVLLLVLLSVPAAVACYTMGGVDWRNLAAAYLVLTLLSLQYAAVGLLISSYAANTEAALRLTYGTVLLMAVVTLGPHQFLKGIAPEPVMLLVEWIRSLSPIPAMMDVLGHSGVGQAGMIGAGAMVARYSALAIITIVVALLWTASRLNQKMFDRARHSGKITEDQSKGVRVYRRLMFIYDPQRRRGLIGPWTNPVMIKEFRTRRFGRTHWILRTAALCLILSLALMLAVASGTMSWGVASLGAVIVLLQMALIVLVTPALASGMISGERETRGWQLLQTTPLSPFSIVAGKLLSVCFTLFLLLLATIPAYAVMYFIDDTQKARIAMVLLSLVLTAMLSMFLSAAVSSMFDRTAPATATAYALLTTLCAGTMLFWLGRDAPFSKHTVEAVIRFNPLAAALRLIEVPGFMDYNLIPYNWWFVGLTCLVCVAVLGVRTWHLSKPS